MTASTQLHHPWLVAVWPGMGSVALSAGYYLLAKLGMHLLLEYEARELFDVDHVEVRDGIIQSGARPRNRFFVWHDPHARHDLVLFLGEAQPPLGKNLLCHKLVAYARQLGVERVFTFAAMATPMRPNARPRVFAAATNRANLCELKRLDLTVLENGRIGGLNGVMLGTAAEQGLPGVCLLGEMPHLFGQFPFPRASHAILEVFAALADLELDLTELAEQVLQVEEQLGGLLARVQQEYDEQVAGDDEVPNQIPSEHRLSPAASQRIEQLFEQARCDRSQAFVLKQELEHLGVFKDYEDRFLDLFKRPG
ncbi:MAG: PAC2 family protein [Planctomycetia bacterium]|nr:PAC2 family protein [Planctomycetia bacterium]